MKQLVRGLAVSVLECAAGLALFILLPARLLRLAIDQGPVFSLWTGTPIVTLGRNAKAERLLGCDSRSLVTHTYYISQEFDYDLSRFRSIPIVGLLVPLAIFAWACVVADRLHFFCDRGILPPRRSFSFNAFELWVYSVLRVDVFLWTYGADVRTREATLKLGQPNCCTDCTAIGKACVCDDKRGARNMRRLQKFARAIFSMGDMIEYTPGSHNGLFFWPIDLAAQGGKKYEPTYPKPSSTGPLHVVHAPNHRTFKGTRYLEQAVKELQSEGLAIELDLVEAVPNNEALSRYRSADLIFDQCLVGYHGYFALEAMALGKPVMCFIRKPKAYLLAADECPIINTHISKLKDDLRYFAQDRQVLSKLGEQGRRYIERHYTPEAFAARLGRAYEELGVRA